MAYDGWDDYVPPAPRAKGANPQRLPLADSVAQTATRAAPAKETARKGPARITTNKRCYVSVERRCILEGDAAKAAKGSGWELESFQSKREAKRFLVLLQRQDSGLIRLLDRQCRFALNVVRPDGLIETIAHWSCDFEYDELVTTGVPPRERWERVVEDSKGYRTEMYLRSKKHFEAQYGIRIRET